MMVARTRGELAEALARLRGDGRAVALVPTMGALHAGHLELVRLAAGHGAPVASIFVNPTQFAAGEDFARYPRDTDGDLAKLAGAGCAAAWLPDVAEMYPPGDATLIEVAGPALGFEGAARPTHFRGVATVVAKLFGQVRPEAAVFGEKDWQQLQVIRRMVADLLLSVRIVAAPIVREADGLAMSSRNRYLSPAERAAAPALPLVLQRAAAAVKQNAGAALEDAVRALREAGFAPDYVALVDGPTMRPLPAAAEGARLIAAARLGAVRLLDNIAVR